jgi:septum formation protein
LLQQIGILPGVRAADIDETPHAGEAPADYVRRLARTKAATVAARAADAVVLGADTAVVIDGDILGKPSDAHSAQSMLARLAGRDHHVVTGVSVVSGEQIRTALSASRVTFRPLGPREIAAYVGSAEGADKAGGYAIQGRGAIFVSHLDGSYSGVVGLPLCETALLLHEFGL